jgi:hypothetical protein
MKKRTIYPGNASSLRAYDAGVAHQFKSDDEFEGRRFAIVAATLANGIYPGGFQRGLNPNRDWSIYDRRRALRFAFRRRPWSTRGGDAGGGQSL